MVWSCAGMGGWKAPRGASVKGACVGRAGRGPRRGAGPQLGAAATGTAQGGAPRLRPGPARRRYACHSWGKDLAGWVPSGSEEPSRVPQNTPLQLEGPSLFIGI